MPTDPTPPQAATATDAATYAATVRPAFYYSGQPVYNAADVGDAYAAGFAACRERAAKVAESFYSVAKSEESDYSDYRAYQSDYTRIAHAIRELRAPQ